MPLDCVFDASETIFPNDEKLKCGDIYIRTTGIISLSCGFCDAVEFFTLDTYSDHFNSHFPARKQPAAASTIKLEPLIIQPDDTHSVSSFGNQVDDVADESDIADDPLEREELQASNGDKALQTGVVVKDEKDDNNSCAPIKGPITCDYCQAVPGSKNNLIGHMWRMHSFGFGCGQCDNQYPTENSRDEHVAKEHQQPVKFQCKICNVSATSKRNCSKHMWKVHSIGVPCRHCDKQLSTKYSRDKHELIHTLESQTDADKRLQLKTACTCSRPDCPKHAFTCDICNAGVTAKAYLEQHKWRVHSVGAACRHCDRQFASERTKDEHEKIHTGEPRTRKRKPACKCSKPECPKHKRHRRRPHQVYREPFNCEHCEAVFPWRSELRAHNWAAHKVGEKCRFCSKHFLEAVNRNTHERTHTGEHPFKCTHCPRTFISRTPMKHHIMLHENDLPFLCPNCGKRFVTTTQLKIHVRDKHSEFRVSGYPCTLCGKSFTQLYTLNKHKKKHQQHAMGLVVVFTCDICQRQLTDRKCLVQHMKIHTGTKPYKCRYCEMTFAQAAGKRGHERNRHENVVF